jgi:hypothetical protein
MPSEVRELPLPTPYPDYSGPPGSAGDHEHPLAKLPESTEEFDVDQSVHNSVGDELDLILDEQVAEPDPALATDEALAARIRSGGTAGATPSFLETKPGQPGTAEVFGGVKAGSDVVVSAPTSWGSRVFSRLVSGRTYVRAEADPRTAEEHVQSHGLGAWMSVLLLSYASAVTMGLCWILWTGRTFSGATPSESSAERSDIEEPVTSSEPVPREELPAIPTENVTALGQTIKIGDIEITPLAVQLARVNLVRRIKPAKSHREKDNSLILRLKLANVSNDDALGPLSRSLVRDQESALDRSFIVAPDGKHIGLYPLAVESEWLIKGQEFPILKPGESALTLLASEPIKEDRLLGVMTWRIPLRIGRYRTDMVGVRFSRSEISR